MAHTTPAVNLVWAIMTIMLGSFLVFHLWSFDRFKCLKWNHGPHSGAFKRIMTYSYLTSVPLVIIYAVGFATIKYDYGFTVIPGQGIIPTPYELWSDSAQRAILPLYLCFAIAWGLEMVTHLEELCFWLFLVNAGSAKQDWFRSLYFKTWAFGSVIAVIYMPLITIFTRSDPYKCEAYTFLAGSLGSFSLTVWFLPVLWAFPGFLQSLKQSNVDTNTMVRLTKFHELNCIRIVFRFLFTVPFIILGIDGVRPHQHINDKIVCNSLMSTAIDLLAMIAGIGCVVSSGITLVIFFPRSIEGEIASKEAARERRQQASFGRRSTVQSQFTTQYQDHYQLSKPLPQITSPVPRGSIVLPSYDEYGGEYISPSRSGMDDLDIDIKHVSPTLVMHPNRRTRDGDVELGGVILTETNLTRHNANLRSPNVNHLLRNFKSPIGGSLICFFTLMSMYSCHLECQNLQMLHIGTIEFALDND
ncbi:hypothetical protein BJ138DRAFT_1012871 [Hygrophoropsis aurantiaca]|uniref:Uncharacterized protein n=1 Tax=Hygrophoropsis aurantiaca TaxID=72124 RepID=A0ACB8A5C8_9AGAM|nr:hypothetical protein BJ138DRAFT_1012871 [Hygrophoropsis aurantiaca]